MRGVRRGGLNLRNLGGSPLGSVTRLDTKSTEKTRLTAKDAKEREGNPILSG
jgi:hypothetical protein